MHNEPRIPALTVAQAEPSTRTTLEGIGRRLGRVPNLHATFAHAPAVLDGYLAFHQALGRGRLTARQRELLALAIGQTNACQYCLSAHTAIGSGLGLTAQEISAARAGQAGDPLDRALVALALRLVRQHGALSDAELAEARADGVDDGLLIEVVGQVSLNILTNYVNHVAGTHIDFPVVGLEIA